ncbi:MAG: DNA polymerase III subunit alpha [Verrucomicrobia bacterium]|nr:DNA polymerase III subunit alpha [Verrucomicrobiota bacterium]
MSDSFVHLHCHTEYSTLDGMVRVDAAVKQAKKMGMPALAITDHGAMYGAVDFYLACQKAEIRPIVGCEVYVAPDSHTKKSAVSQKESAFHLTLLASDLDGYKNLVRLVSTAHLDGFYYKPRIDKELLAKHAKGIIGLSGCLKGEVPHAIHAEDNLAKATQLAATYRDILGPENFFLELSDHGIAAQSKVNATLPKLARDLGLGLVATNDVHFLNKEDHGAHDVLICIGTGAKVSDEKRMKYVQEVYFKSPGEMRALFADYDGACDNTLAIAERCGFKLDTSPKYPDYQPPAGKTRNEYLREITEAGLRKRYGADADSEAVQRRYALEIDVLEKQDFVNYFLIVWDFIHWARQQGIPVGPGRGSAAGSIIAYAMGITDIDPLKFKLLFERFLNPERVSPPDIDVDFCQNRRGEVIDYVKRKYGERAVSQIITFGTLGAKSVIRDVARVLDWNYNDADRIAKMIPAENNITLTGYEGKNKDTGAAEHVPGAIDKNPELAQAVKTDPNTAHMWEAATKLEGLTRGVGVHAAGVVISDRDLSEYIPLTRANDGSIVSQYAMGALTEVGMLKCDFLGLKTLTVIQDAVALIHKHTPGFNIDTIPFDDEATFNIYNRGETVAVFQVESGGMTGWAKQFDVRTIEDINALIALYRPGPMDLIPDYVKRKKGLAKVRAPHKLLEEVTSETFGVLIYQEQVMQAAQVLAGYTLGGADLLRRAMGKKDKKKMAEERIKFCAGAAKLHGIKEDKANEVFDTLEKFAGYGFNRSHSAAYAWLSYQTGFLKANYPVEFMAAVMSNEVSNTEKISVFVAECERLGIKIMPPDINRSGLKFEPDHVDAAGVEAAKAARKTALAQAAKSGDEEFPSIAPDPEPGSEVRFEDLAAGAKPNGTAQVANGTNGTPPAAGDRIRLGAIRYGLAAIKNVGESAMESAMAERARGGAFKGMEDFCSRVDGKKISKKAIECLVKSGAFDEFGADRATMFAGIEGAMASAASAHRDRAAGQVSLFGDIGVATPPATKRAVSTVPPWSLTEKLAFEKELLGFYVTGHPLDEYRSALENPKYVPIAKLASQESKSIVTIAGQLASVERKFTKKDGKPFAIVVVEDFTGTIEVMIWNEAFTKVQKHLEAGAVVTLKGRLDQRDEGPRIAADEVTPLKKPAPAEKPLVLKLDRAKSTEADLLRIRDVLGRNPGTRRVELCFPDGRLILPPEFRIALSESAKEELAQWIR